MPSQRLPVLDPAATRSDQIACKRFDVAVTLRIRPRCDCMTRKTLNLRLRVFSACLGSAPPDPSTRCDSKSLRILNFCLPVSQRPRLFHPTAASPLPGPAPAPRCEPVFERCPTKARKFPREHAYSISTYTLAFQTRTPSVTEAADPPSVPSGQNETSPAPVS